MSGTRHLLAVSLGMVWLAFSASSLRANSQTADHCAVFAPEAAMRSGLPLDMILRVMRAESGDNPRAVSSKGAIGCMQIMPATWATLSMRYGFRSDPFDARMNMIGGALYLAELCARFGIPGAYAAYNAGPGRYTRFATNGVPLPTETVAYAARLSGVAPPIIKVNAQARWQEAAMFVARSASVQKPSRVSSSPAVGANDAGASNDISTSYSAPAVRVDSMFPLPVRNVALRR